MSAQILGKARLTELVDEVSGSFAHVAVDSPANPPLDGPSAATLTELTSDAADTHGAPRSVTPPSASSSSSSTVEAATEVATSLEGLVHPPLPQPPQALVLHEKSKADLEKERARKEAKRAARATDQMVKQKLQTVVEGFHAQGLWLIKEGKIRQGIFILTKALQLTEHPSPVLVSRSQAFVMVTDEAGCLLDAEAALKAEPHSHLMSMNRGWAMIYACQFKEAAEAFTTGLRMNPSYATEAARQEAIYSFFDAKFPESMIFRARPPPPLQARSYKEEAMQLYRTRIDEIRSLALAPMSLPSVFVVTDAQRLESLRELTIRDLQVARYHPWSYVRLRTVATGGKRVDTFSVVADKNGDHASLLLCCYIPSAGMFTDVGDWLPNGTELAVVNPYFDMYPHGESPHIYCNLLHNIIILERPKSATKGSPSIRATRSKGKEIKRTTSGGGTGSGSASEATSKSNARYKQALALHQAGDDAGALQALTGNFHGTELSAEARQLLHAIERRSGRYDVQFMLREVPAMSVWEGLDHANYAGAFEFVLWEQRNVIKAVATADIPAGALLVAHKAISLVLGSEFQELPLPTSFSTTTHQFLFLTLRIAKLMRRLEQDPSAAQTLHRIASGDSIRDTSPFEPVFWDVSQYAKLNSHQISEQLGKPLPPNSQGVWADLLVYFRHSCLFNTCTYFVGDFAFVHAVRDIPKGDEIVLHYGPCGWMSQREKLAYRFGFTCTCDLCAEDQSMEKEGRDALADLLLRFEAAKESRAPSNEFEEMLGRLQEAPLQKHKRLPYYPELGEVAFEIFRTKVNERKFCNVDRFFSLALKNAGANPSDFQAYLVTLQQLRQAGQRDLADHLERKVMRYYTKLFGSDLCATFISSSPALK